MAAGSVPALGDSPRVQSQIDSLRHAMRTSQLLHDMSKVTIAAINGACAGAGLAWACAADLRYCAESAVFNTAFMTAGLSGDFDGQGLSFGVLQWNLGQGSLQPLLADSGRRVVLEITEHDPVHDYQALRRAIERLGNGVELSVDDAGSGFASLRHVLALGPSFMKLDASWVSGIDQDPARQALIAGLAHFATETGCHLIAEGIERQPELDMLQRLEVELGQGYLLGEPAPA